MPPNLRPRQPPKPDVSPIQDETGDTGLHSSDFELRRALDYGTSQTSFGELALKKGTLPNPDQPQILPLQDNQPKVAQVIGSAKVDGDFRFFWGDEMEKILLRTDLSRDEVFVFPNPKMFIWPSEVQELARRQAEAELERYEKVTGSQEQRTLEWLATQHLRAVREAAEEASVSAWKHTWTAEEVGRMKVTWFLTVPEISKDVSSEATNKSLAEMAEAAGFPPGIILVTETESAAAHRLHRYLRSIKGAPSPLKVNLQDQWCLFNADLLPQAGDHVVVADGGGGTTNIAKLKLKDDPNNIVAIDMALLGCQGCAVGAELPSKDCMQQIKDYCNNPDNAHEFPGGFQGYLDELDMSEEQFEWQVRRNFESYKQMFHREELRIITIRGKNRQTGCLSQKHFTVTRYVSH